MLRPIDRDDALSAASSPDHDGPAIQLLEVKSVQRLSILNEDKVRRIDNVIDRANSHQAKPVPQPERRGANLHAHYEAGGVTGT